MIVQPTKQKNYTKYFIYNWTKEALDNENFGDQDLTVTTNVKNYITQVLYQDAADKPISKPSISSTNLK